MLGSENDGMFHLDVDGTVIKNYLFDKTDDLMILDRCLDLQR